MADRDGGGGGGHAVAAALRDRASGAQGFAPCEQGLLRFATPRKLRRIKC